MVELSIDEKKKLMEPVFKTLKSEGINFMSVAFDTKAKVLGQSVNYTISIYGAGYCLESGDDFMSLTFDSVAKLFDTIYFMYHCTLKASQTNGREF